jgi:predicted YcjX-like family ATPase
MNDLPTKSRVTLIIDIVEYDGRWLLRLAKNIYSEHADKQRAQREALELTADARKLGHAVEVWDRAAGKRLL